MTRARFIRSSGWGLALAAVCLLLTLLPLPEGVQALPFPLAILLVTLGLLGMRARYGGRTGPAANLALGVGVLGGLAGLASSLWMASGYADGRSLMNSSMAVMFAGLFVFGLAAWRVKPMRRGNWLPALAGFWWPAIWIRAFVNQAAGQPGTEVPFWLSFALFSTMSLFLAGLGYVLQSDALPAQAAA